MDLGLIRKFSRSTSSVLNFNTLPRCPDDLRAVILFSKQWHAHFVGVHEVIRDT